jgi:hypothetical protein
MPEKNITGGRFLQIAPFSAELRPAVKDVVSTIQRYVWYIFFRTTPYPTD